MLLHAKAALSLKERLLLSQRVVERQWTLTKAAEAAEVSVRTARKWSAATAPKDGRASPTVPQRRRVSRREPVTSACRRSPRRGDCG
jgi:plasmid stabilization system protein ParE